MGLLDKLKAFVRPKPANIGQLNRIATKPTQPSKRHTPEPSSEPGLCVTSLFPELSQKMEGNADIVHIGDLARINRSKSALFQHRVQGSPLET